MVQKQIDTNIIKSGKHKLRKITKPQIRRLLKQKQVFRGYLCGNLINPIHIADELGLGLYVDVADVTQFDQIDKYFNTRLRVHTPEFGRYANYYELIK